MNAVLALELDGQDFHTWQKRCEHWQRRAREAWQQRWSYLRVLKGLSLRIDEDLNAFREICCGRTINVDMAQRGLFLLWKLSWRRVFPEKGIIGIDRRWFRTLKMQKLISGSPRYAQCCFSYVLDMVKLSVLDTSLFHWKESTVFAFYLTLNHRGSGEPLCPRLLEQMQETRWASIRVQLMNGGMRHLLRMVQGKVSPEYFKWPVSLREEYASLIHMAMKREGDDI